MKKRILALLLAFSMMLSLLPVSALADTGGGIGSAVYASNGSLPDLVMDNDTGKPDVSQIEPVSRGVYQGNGWMYNKNSDALMLKSGKYDFNYTFPGFSDSKHYDDCDHLNCVNVNHIVVQLDATIVGGMFNGQSLLNHGTVTNGLFKGTSVTNHGTLNCLFPPNSDNSKPTGIGTIECHSLTAADNSIVEVLLYSSTFGNTTTTYSEGTFYFTGTPTLEVKLSSNEEITCINGEKLYGGLTKPDWKGYQTFTPKAGEDVVLSSSETTASALEMNYNGWPKTDNMTPINNVYYGDGWKYENGTLTLKSGEYDFNYTKPKDTASERYSYTVECNVVVNKGAAITGGKFSGDTFSNSGTVKDVLIKEGQITNNGTLSCLFGLLPPSGTGFTRHTMTAVDGSKIYYTVNQHLSIGGVYKLYFTGTPKFTVRLENSTIHYINGEEHYGGLTSPDGKGYQTFTPQIEEDIVLNREPYATDLVITEGGIPDTTGREPIYDSANNVIGCKGEGWKYENDTLTLESGSYDFSKNGLGQLAPDVKLVVGPSVTLTGGVFNEKPDGLTTDNVQTIILNGSGSIEAVNGLSSPKWNTTLYAIKGSQVEIKASVPLTDINCRAIKSRYYLDNNDKTALRFTANFSFLDTYGGPELILNKSSRTNLIMKEDGSPDLEGIPYDWSGEHLANIYTGDGWRYVDGPSKYLELTAHSYNFRYCDPLNNKISSELAAVTCDITNSSGATIEDGIFKNFVENYGGTINGGTFAAGLLVRYATEQGTVTGGAFNGKDGLSDGAHAVTVNGGSIRKVNDTEPLVLDSSHNLTTGTEWNLYSYEGTIVTVTADTDITNINGWDVGKFTASSYPNGADDKKTVSFRMPDGPVVLNDTLYTLDIIRGKTLGNTSVAVPAGTELKLDADEPAKNETFLGWTLSDESLLTKGTLNDPECTTITIKMNNASATAEAKFQKDTPAYTLTVTGGGLVNSKTSAVVEVGKEVCLTVGEMQEGMSFNYWDLPTPLLKALTDSSSGGFSNKVESLTFTMPDLSGYTEDTRFTIRLDIRPAELPDDDDGPSVLGTMATVAVGGAAAGILVWQGVSLGVDSYLQLSLPDGVPVPANRIELVKLLWETAGKPDVVLPALYGDVSAEDGELQKATRWAIDNGLVKSADESDASRFDPDRSVSKYEVARAWFKVQQMLK